MKKIHNPHDKYFRLAMSDVRVATEFFEKYLPQEIAEIIDLKTLQLQDSSFVDESLGASMADILYEVHCHQEKGYLYVLVEHQRKPDEMMPYRLMRYMLRIMEYHLKQKQSKRLPVVIPLVFYNGDAPYPYSMDFFDLFGDQGDLAKQVFLKPFALVDLSQIPDEELKGFHWLGMLAFLQKHIGRPNFMRIVRESIPFFIRLHQADANEYVSASLSYILQSNLENPAEVAKMISSNVSASLGEEIMSLAEKLEQAGFQKGIAEGRTKGETMGLYKGEKIGLNKGRAEGLAEGRAEGRSEGEKIGRNKGAMKAQQEIAQNMLAQGADPRFVSTVTGLSLKEIEHLVQYQD